MALGLALVGDAVGRIRPEAVGQRPAGQAGDVGKVGAVATQEPVIAEGVEVGPIDIRLGRELRDVIGIDEPDSTGVEALFACEIVKERPECLIGWVQPGQQGRELLGFGRRHRREGIE